MFSNKGIIVYSPDEFYIDIKIISIKPMKQHTYDTISYHLLNAYYVLGHILAMVWILLHFCVTIIL